MKLTDKRIIEIAGETLGLNREGYPCFEGDVDEIVTFARALLEEADEYEPVAWMADSERSFFNQGSSAFVTVYRQPARNDGTVLYRKK